MMLFGVPGTLGNRLRTLKGIRFSHFGAPFWRDEFKARSGKVFCRGFLRFLTLFGHLSGTVLGRNREKVGYEKRIEKKC